MPNWCYNSVRFKGEARQLAELDKAVLAMIAKEKRERRGQLFPFMENLDGYFFDMAFEDGKFSYLSKWVQNTKELVAVAKKWKLDFAHSFDEPGNMIYGRVYFIGGEATEFLLDESDFDAYTFDGESGCYLFEGRRYQDSDPIKEILLSRMLDSGLLNLEQHFEELKR